MKKEKRVILYYGEDPEFVQSLETYFKRFHRDLVHELTCLDYKKTSIADYFIEHGKAHLIFIDFFDISDKQLLSLLAEINLLKQSALYKSSTIMGLFADKDTLVSQEYLLSSGISLAYIQGRSMTDFICDSFEIAFDDTLFQPRYAKVDHVDLQIQIGFCSLLTQMDDKQFSIESDYEVHGKKIQTNLAMFKALTATEFDILKTYPFALKSPLDFTYQIKFPIAGAWEADSTNLIHKATLDTWLDLKSDLFEAPKPRIKIFTNQAKLTVLLAKQQSKMDISFDISAQWSTALFNEHRALKKPQLIFYDMYEAEEGIGVKGLSDLTDILSNQRGNKPIVIITNTPSKTEALRKLYQYPHLLAIEGPLTEEIVQLFSKKFVESGKTQGQVKPTQIKCNQPARSITIYDQFIFNSLTEREFTFLSKVEIPFYTTVKLNLSFIVYGTLVPYELSTNKKKDYYHYKAIIHGVEEGELEKLRKLVNQLIFNPVDDLNPKTLKDLIAQSPIQMVPLPEKVLEEVRTTEQEVFTLSVKKMNSGIKSKL